MFSIYTLHFQVYSAMPGTFYVQGVPVKIFYQEIGEPLINEPFFLRYLVQGVPTKNASSGDSDTYNGEAKG